ncbi:MAG: DNA-binding MarR family transcriptional regulator [Gammaproteobacteria bacterium]|jgi:DNA-binding MarR family transcriptional regulator
MAAQARRRGQAQKPDSTRGAQGVRGLQAVESMFYADREFTSDPDEILAAHQFGRAHHRVVHFVGPQPGMHIAALLDVLKIIKQSLNRVLKQLIAQGYVRQEPGSWTGANVVCT